MSAALVAAQEEAPAPILSDRPDASSNIDLLANGETFDSPSGGIVLRLPAGMKLIRRGSAGGGDDLAQFADEQRGWVLRIRRNTSPAPLPLMPAPDARGNSSDAAASIVGNVQRDLLTEHPRAQVLREDAMILNDKDVALLAARITLGTRRHLLQQAIIAVNSRVYYVLTLSSPTGVPADADDSVEDPRERLAVRAFEQTLATVELADLAHIRQDQDQRLLATRELYEQITPERIQAVLQQEQWLRIVRDGRDAGYTYVIEEIDAENATDSIVVAMRTRTVEPEESRSDQQRPVSNSPARHDAESWMHLSADRRHESWSTVQVVSDAEGKAINHTSELGSSDFIVRRVLDRRQANADAADPKQPPVREEEQYSLKVTHVAKSVTAPPVERQLPPFYLPKALGHLLPRLLPLDQPHGYLFASYVSDTRQIMLHYVDVAEEADVKLNGAAVRAVAVTERIGQDGPPTMHYLSRDGKYLGSVSPQTHITILPADEETLLEIWKDADLSRPDAPPEPAE